MGNYLSTIKSPLNKIGTIVSRKRKRDETSADLEAITKAMNVPQRKKLLTTAQHVYQVLFKEQRSSDITINSLGKSWKLHKVYLQQSPYFNCMFNGSWAESNLSVIDLDSIDPRMTIESLDIVFGSMYQDEVDLTPSLIVSIYATAFAFQLNDLLDRCTEVMTVTVNAETVFNYYNIAIEFGNKVIENATFDWLTINLLSYIYNHPKYIKEIDIDLMTRLIKCDNLFVMQTEFSVYIFLRFWIYIKLHMNENINDLCITDNKIAIFFEEARVANNIPFVYSEEGACFLEPFKNLSVPNLIAHSNDVKIILKDYIIPVYWFTDALMDQWLKLLLMDQSYDIGPTEVENRQSIVRWGRKIKSMGNFRWRWLGFHFGMDLVMTINNRSIYIKRNFRSEHERVLSLQVKRDALIKVTLYSLNEMRGISHQQTTDYKFVTFLQNDDVKLVEMDYNLTAPFLISLNVVFSSEKKFLDYINEPYSESPFS